MNTDLNKANHEVNAGPERSFGQVFSVLFIFLAILPMVDGGSANVWFLLAGVTMFAVSIFCPRILKRPNILWFKFGLFLGRIVSPVVMLLVFLVGFLPIGLLLRVVKKDPLKRAIDKSASTYWLQRRDKMQSMKRQF